MPKVYRLEKLESDFLRIMSKALMDWKNLDFPKEKITFTRVLLSKDKRFLEVFISVLSPSGNAEEQEQLFGKLQEHIRYFRAFLAKNSRMYVAPEIRMVLDRGIEQSVKMQKILDELKND